MLLLEQNTTKKGQVVKNNITELNAGDNKGGEYKVKAIYDSAIYVNESAGHFPGLYYLVS